MDGHEPSRPIRPEPTAIQRILPAKPHLGSMATPADDDAVASAGVGIGLRMAAGF